MGLLWRVVCDGGHNSVFGLCEWASTVTKHACFELQREPPLIRRSIAGKANLPGSLAGPGMGPLFATSSAVQHLLSDESRMYRIAQSARGEAGRRRRFMTLPKPAALFPEGRRFCVSYSGCTACTLLARFGSFACGAGRMMGRSEFCSGNWSCSTTFSSDL